MKTRTFTISRRKWLRGSNDSYLLHSVTGKMCCLGIISRQCGVPAKAIKSTVCPEDIYEVYKYKDKIGFMLTSNNQDLRWIADAIDINDDSDMTDVKREKKLTSLFKKHNIELVFTK